MWPDQVSNPGPLTFKSGALPTALDGLAFLVVKLLVKILRILSMHPQSDISFSKGDNLGDCLFPFPKCGHLRTKMGSHKSFKTSIHHRMILSHLPDTGRQLERYNKADMGK